MNDPRAVVEDAGYVVVGLGVIAFQRAQVGRRQLERQVARVSSALESRRTLVGERLEAFGGQVETAADALATLTSPSPR